MAALGLQKSGAAEPSSQKSEDAFSVNTDMGFLSAPVGASADQVYEFIMVWTHTLSCLHHPCTRRLSSMAYCGMMVHSVLTQK